MSYGVRRKFYTSTTWEKTRKIVWLKQKLLCNRCGRPVFVSGLNDYIPKDQRVTGIVHHKIYLDNNNVYDKSISLNLDNLEGLCKYCHEKEHYQPSSIRKEYKFDELGNLVKSE